VVYLVAYYCFRIRKSERAGDLLAFGWLKPVFRWGVGVCVGYVCGIVAREFLSMVEITVSLPVLFLLIVVFGIIAFYVADMFVQKSFRVFNRRRFRECCLFLGFSLLGFGVINGVSRAIEYYIPSESQISAAYLYMNYPVEFRGEDITKVVDVQKEILDKSAVFEKETQSTGEAGYIYLIYVLDNGNRIERNYTIPYKDEWCSTLVDTLYSYETEPENFMHYMVGYDYEQIASFTDVELEYDTQGDNYVRHNIDTVSARRIYDAVCRDAQEGTLQKYNVSNYMKQDSEEDYEIAYLYFSYLHKDSDWEDVFSRTGQNNMAYYDSYMDANERRYGYMNLSFGADCTNIIEALCQEGVISSEEDLLFRSAE
jgi:ABC-2 type transport system permease protein